MSTMGLVSTLPSSGEAASFSLDFERESYRIREGGQLVSKQLSDVVKEERNTSAGRWNSKGLYEMVPANQPRLNYDPLTKKLKGLLSESATTNLAPYSDNLLSTSWVKIQGWVDLVGTSPMGRSYKFIPGPVAATHFLQRTYNAMATGTYTTTRLMKAGELTKVRGALFGSSEFGRADFDLAAGTVVATVGTATIDHVGDGWYLCSITGRWTTTENMTDRWYPVKGTETAFSGNGVEGYYVSNSQMELSTYRSLYVPSVDTFSSRPSPAKYFDSQGILRTAKTNEERKNSFIFDQNNLLVPIGTLLEASGATNRIRSSSDFSTNQWIKPTATVRLSSGSKAPDGTVSTRVSLIGTVGHNLNQVLDAPLTVGTTYTLSIWLKAIKGSLSFQLAYYDASVVGFSTGVRATSEWRRFTFSFTPDKILASPQIRLLGYSNGVDGDVIDIFGPMLEVGNIATSHVDSLPQFTGRASGAMMFDGTGTLQPVAAGVVRANSFKHDADGVLRPNGTLLEGSAVNYLGLSSDYVGWSQGGPGTSPVSVTPAASDGPRGPMTMSLLKRADLGIRYLSKVLNTPAGAITYSHYVKRADNTKFFCIRLQAGSSNERVDVRFDMALGTSIVNSVGTTISEVYTSMEPVGQGTGIYRCIVTALSTNPWTTVIVAPMDRAASIDSTPAELSDVYLDAGQVEMGYAATSYIHVPANTTVARASDVYTAASATRAADVSSSAQATKASDLLSVSPISDWFSQTAGAFFLSADFLAGSDEQNKHALNVRGPTTADWLGIRHANRLLMVGSGNSSGSATTIINTNRELATGVSFKAALRYANNDCAFAVDGSLMGTDNTALYPAVVPYTLLALGSFGGGTLNMCGHIHSVQYYRSPLSNDQLQMITN